MRWRSFLEEGVTFQQERTPLKNPYPEFFPEQRSLTNFDYRMSAPLWTALNFQVSGRVQLLLEEPIKTPKSENYKNYLRETYVSYEKNSIFYLDVGRINIRNGVALGYNPTDFFKSRSALLQSSMDPSALRENRLGSFAMQARWLGASSSLSLAISPTLHKANPLRETKSEIFDPLWGLSNSNQRLLVAYSFEWLDFAPQLLYHRLEDRERWGLNLSQTIGNSVVTYFEWSGGMEKKITTRALEFGKKMGELPVTTPDLTGQTNRFSFQNDYAVGLSWTSTSKVTLNLEYHFHQSGLRSSEFRNWLQIGEKNANMASVLWYLRQYALDQQELLEQEQIFLRASFPDFTWHHHELNLLAFINSRDGSYVSQLESQYNANDHWTFSGDLVRYFGAKESERGSLPANVALTFKAKYFF